MGLGKNFLGRFRRGGNIQICLYDVIQVGTGLKGGMDISDLYTVNFLGDYGSLHAYE